MEMLEGKEEFAVLEDDAASEEGEFHDAQPIPTLQVSMHALCGTPTTVHTFTLKLSVGNKTAIALVDTGSDASFNNTKFALNSKCPISNDSVVQISAANGKNMTSTSACLSCP